MRSKTWIWVAAAALAVTAAAAYAASQLPPPEAGALWSYIHGQDYQTSWKMWPGKKAFYEGTRPHGALLTTYVNDVAYEAITQKAGRLPDGSIIVKENYTPDKKLAVVTVMYKSHGYDPEHDDWFWLKQAPDGTVQASGKVESCQHCHAKGTDFIRGEDIGS